MRDQNDNATFAASRMPAPISTMLNGSKAGILNILVLLIKRTTRCCCPRFYCLKLGRLTAEGTSGDGGYAVNLTPSGRCRGDECRTAYLMVEA